MKREDMQSLGFATRAIHGGTTANSFGALTSPIYQTSTFVFDSAAQGGRRFALEEPGYIYSRLGNPTTAVAEEKLAMLEGTEDCVAAGSGMGAIAAALWSLLKQGDHIVAGDTLYGCTFALMNHGLSTFGVETTFVDMSDLDAVQKAMRPNTKIVYLETPANPTLKVTDIAAISTIAHAVEGCQVIVDNTFCTPYIQRPVEYGADIVVHSATKYLNGHGDVIAGFVCGKKEFITQVRLFGIKDMTGSVLSPFDSFLIARGMKTLAIRMEKHCANAMKVAAFLEKHPAVASVSYPGLTSFPQYELAKKQMSLPGGMISFELKGGKAAGAIVMDNVHLCKLAVSLGDAETLIEHAATMTHSTYTPEELKMAGISEGLVRLSVGLEDPEDIIADLDQALNCISK
ncbi:methionine gamma-lyase [uncultured Megasphaera sp.]|uniref:methionine gamma-lyase n=1 Tax=uncultured Megasphaera sp. TaxID=165188 RepID=UPI00265A0AFE|nr:methionine gamma-lyase [uncultured Megasphaera sp.]